MILKSKISSVILMQSIIKLLILESSIITVYNMRSYIKKDILLNSKIEPRII